MELQITCLDQSEWRPLPSDESKLGFGRHFSDHMFLMEYTPDRGWHNARIEPRHPLSLDPATMVLHYGQEAFEGLKAYRGQDRGIYLFRYRDNLQRLNNSAERLVMPTFDIDFVASALKKLVLLDQRWIPTSPGSALYIRPNLIATDPFIGVRPSRNYLLYIIVGPVGAYYPEGFNPVSIYVSDHYVRAVKGGIGAAKTGGNYAASLAAQREAQQQGFTQVLWLDAIEHRYVEEVGTMNIMFVIDDEIVTSPLTGSILPGITREAVITIARHWGLKMVERMLGIDEVVECATNGRLTECFGTGTAAIISPVGRIHYMGKTHTVADGQTGPISKRLYDYILGLQYGRIEDPFGWVERIDLAG
ncbi:MAG: branched-chain amino acid aminotransferase [Bradymonadales bacterium]|nr:branched-chain amino acid aminotransferase [Bradymonadales bacterium]